ncbi:Hypothetical protein, putative [Bodo saltans]|uniref:Uncharacterized protein n=1 Tax=Bodo saltans TaxID=75058 RepID=A0A0S4JHS6_BODSA|nr:Hypothetical protein, putative [Bodo saltans]|eukprot:CUG89715.1 Hypothetical protein, putative [Bodo saltans]
MTLWDIEEGAAPTVPWGDDTVTLTVMPFTSINWEQGNRRIIDYIEMPSHERIPHVDIHVCRVTTKIDDELKNAPTLHAERMVLSYDTEATTHQLLAFDGTVSMTIELKCMSNAEATEWRRLSNDEAMMLRADLDQHAANGSTSSVPTKPISLAEAAATMRAGAAKSVHGSRVHRLLSAWNDALTAGRQMVAVLSALPFGKLLLRLPLDYSLL